ncbi:MAG: MmcQ/YjbR family DNA-binding protein [Actinobacteria bacterium]|nr:MAG: MmcQ/YjbR family DNA-binding protein [Actinomycetota bacterium]
MRVVVDPIERELALERIREFCLGLPETSERPSHGAPTFFVRGKRAFVMVLTNHHGDGRFALWCAAATGMQAMLVEGLHWDEIAGIAEDAYAEVAPPALVEAARQKS